MAVAKAQVLVLVEHTVTTLALVAVPAQLVPSLFVELVTTGLVAIVVSLNSRVAIDQEQVVSSKG